MIKGAPYKQEEKGCGPGGLNPVGRIYLGKGQKIKENHKSESRTIFLDYTSKLDFLY